MTLRYSLKKLIRRDPAASLRERAAELRASLPRVAAPQVEAPATSHAEQVARAGASLDVLALSGIDHRDGTVSYADAAGQVVRHPMARWVAFNAMQLHSHIQAEIGRRRIVEANPLSGDERAGWEARIRRELRADAVFALTFNPQRAHKAEDARRSGAEPITADLRAAADAELVALLPAWEAARDAYDEAAQRQLTITEAAMDDDRPGPAPDDSGPDWQAWFERCREWRKRTGVEAAEEASREACRALGVVQDRIADLSAASPAGLRLKALVAQRCGDIDVEWPDGLGEGLTRDLLAFTAEPAVDPGSDGTLTLAALNGTSKRDVTLLQLGREFDAALARREPIREEYDRIDDTWFTTAPRRPDCLVFRESDRPYRLRARISAEPTSENENVLLGDIEAIRGRKFQRSVARPVRAEDNLPPDAHTVTEAKPWPEAQARADEIVAAWDAWKIQQQRRKEEIGLQNAEARLDAVDDEILALAEAIAELPATTAEGMRIKLRASAEYVAEHDGGYPNGRLLNSLLRDAQGGSHEVAPDAPQTDPLPDFKDASINKLARFHDCLQSLAFLVSTACNAPMAYSGDREAQNSIAGVLEAEHQRLDDLAEHVAQVIASRRPSNDSERDDRLTTMVKRQFEVFSKVDELVTVDEIAAAWGDPAP